MKDATVVDYVFDPTVFGIYLYQEGVLLRSFCGVIYKVLCFGNWFRLSPFTDQIDEFFFYDYHRSRQKDYWVYFRISLFLPAIILYGVLISIYDGKNGLKN